MKKTFRTRPHQPAMASEPFLGSFIGILFELFRFLISLVGIFPSRN
jgi:hypothetical protein